MKGPEAHESKVTTEPAQRRHGAPRATRPRDTRRRGRPPARWQAPIPWHNRGRVAPRVPRRRWAPSPTRSAQRARLAPDTTSARCGVRRPTGAPGSARQRCSPTTRPRTASPRNARLSLSAAGACSFAQDRWVSACARSSASAKACPSRAPKASAGSSGSVNARAAGYDFHQLAAPGGRGGLFPERAESQAGRRLEWRGRDVARDATADTCGTRWWRWSRRSRRHC